MALSLLPEPIIEDTYDELIAAMPQQLKNTLNDLLQYFQQQWFVKVPISQWCVHGRNIRTNNNAEGELLLLFNSKCDSRLFSVFSLMQVSEADQNKLKQLLFNVV